MRRKSARIRTIVLLCAVAALSVGALAVLLPGGAGAQSQAATSRVIVVLRNQESGLPATKQNASARQNAEASLQAPLASQLASSGATSVHRYTLINAISATVSGAEEARLRSNPSVSEVVPDQVIHLSSAVPAETAGTSASTGRTAIPGLCGTAAHPQLNPEALPLIHADSDSPYAQTAASLGITGAGVKVAFIADGLDINNQDFIRANGQHVFFDYKDFSGEGTNVATGGAEAFGDASAIAAQGLHTYNVAGYGADAVGGTCDIRIRGVAPGADLAGLSIFGAEDAGFNSSFLQAIDWSVTHDHVQVLNESLGNNFYPDDAASLDLIKLTNDQAVAAGTTVTVSSGDAGVTSTIGTPSTDPSVISVGSTNSYRINLQDGYGGVQFPGVKGYLDSDISTFSSGGFEQSGRTLDVAAPGFDAWALCSTDTAAYFECTNFLGAPSPVQAFGGTSESAPITAGVAALVIQAYEKTHGGTAPTPAVVKQLITSTADDVRAPADQQGAGLVDAYKAVLAAESYQASGSSPKPVGATLLDSSPQLNASGQAGASQTLTDTVTNNGSGTQKVAILARSLTRYTSIADQVATLSDSSSPKTTDWAGHQANYEPITFTVPAGAKRLSTSIAFQAASATDPNARVRMTLVDPAGNLASYDVPQGDGNYGNSQVADPKAGTWTAYIWSKVSSLGGTTGPVRFDASVASWATFGSVTPSSITLAPGASAPVTLKLTQPTTPGDEAGSIVLTSDTGGSTTIPVTVRTLIPAGNRSFQQTLTGGNGRGAITGEAFYYQINVASGAPELNASIALGSAPDSPFTAFLISPSGDAVGYGSNTALNGSTTTNTLGAQVHALSPAAGRWTLIVAFVPQVAGTEVSSPFTVSTNETAVPARTSGLPNSYSTKLPAGKPTTYYVQVTNTGTAPESYFLDARHQSLVTLPLTAANSPDTTVPISVFQNVPAYLVPSDTTSMGITAATTGSRDIMFDASAQAGDPDIGSTTGLNVSASFAASPVAQGIWGVAPDVVGAFTGSGAHTEPVSTQMAVTTLGFDPTLSSAGGDLWQAATNPSLLLSVSPTTVDPGQTGSIAVTITPTGASGQTDRGTLYIDDLSDILFENLISPNASQVAAIHYGYSVK